MKQRAVRSSAYMYLFALPLSRQLYRRNKDKVQPLSPVAVFSDACIPVDGGAGAAGDGGGHSGSPTLGCAG